MKEKTKFKIGEFSRMMQVTVKTLRHYEKKGLLLPYEVDEWTGYRYYTICQMQKLNAIRQLQRLGFTLEEIKELYEEDSHVPSVEQLTEKINKTEELLKQLMERRDQLKEWLESSKNTTIWRNTVLNYCPKLSWQVIEKLFLIMVL